jgi:glycosyltransferase involved in cell wall biosynthesis
MNADGRGLDIVFIEPFDGGSHRSFRLGLETHSRHRFRALALPARFWKWRMRSAAVWFADLLRDSPLPCDLLMTTSMLNVADFRGLLPPPLDRRPLICYMHENQITYPLSPQEEFDFHFGFTSILSCLASDRIVFNSQFHRDLFLDSVPGFLNRMPEAVPRQVRQRLAARTDVLPVGLHREPQEPAQRPVWRGSPCAPAAGPSWPRDGQRLVLLWNHRWEFDKRPDVFASAVNALLDQDLDFAVILLGEPCHQEEVFRSLAGRLGRRCLHFGYAGERRRYDELLGLADIVVSCAEQEYFGISVAEAVHAGCYPVLPRRQVYPSLYGALCRGQHFYSTEAELVSLLADLIRGEGHCGHVCSLARDMDPFCWRRLAPRFDDMFQLVFERNNGYKSPAGP